MTNSRRQKQSVRQILQARRRALSKQQLTKNSRLVVERVRNHILCQQKPLNCAVYLPFNNEIDLTELLSTVANHQFFIPSIKGRQMQFQRYEPQLSIELHRFGMRQPVFLENYAEPQLDICLMPLLGFDNDGNRLGMGGGFYDRYFASNTACRLIGVAHQCQQYQPLPTESWDLKLPQIITEQQVLTV